MKLKKKIDEFKKWDEKIKQKQLNIEQKKCTYDFIFW